MSGTRIFRWIIPTGLAATMLLAGPLAALAGDERPGRERSQAERDEQPERPRRDITPQERILHRLIRDLELTDRQHAEVRDALRASREQRRTWWAEHGQRIGELRAALHEARRDNNRERFRELWADMGELMFEAPHPGDVLHDVRNALTDEQWQTLHERWKQAHERMRERRRDRRDNDKDDNTQEGDEDEA